MSKRYLKEQKEAKKLFYSGMLNQKQIAGKVGVSEKTICIWVKKFGWWQEGESEIYTSNNPLTAYLEFLRTKYPDTFDKVVETFKAFQNKIN